MVAPRTYSQDSSSPLPDTTETRLQSVEDATTRVEAVQPRPPPQPPNAEGTVHEAAAATSPPPQESIVEEGGQAEHLVPSPLSEQASDLQVVTPCQPTLTHEQDTDTSPNHSLSPRDPNCRGGTPSGPHDAAVREHQDGAPNNNPPTATSDHAAELPAAQPSDAVAGTPLVPSPSAMHQVVEQQRVAGTNSASDAASEGVAELEQLAGGPPSSDCVPELSGATTPSEVVAERSGASESVAELSGASPAALRESRAVAMTPPKPRQAQHERDVAPNANESRGAVLPHTPVEVIEATTLTPQQQTRSSSEKPLVCGETTASAADTAEAEQVVASNAPTSDVVIGISETDGRKDDNGGTSCCYYVLSLSCACCICFLALVQHQLHRVRN